MILQGSPKSGAASSAARSIPRCNSASFGFPAGQPSGKSRNTVRGGLNAMLVSQRVLMHNVGNPRASSARAISPTDRWHAGQNGNRKSKSTPCFSSSLWMAGTVFRSKSVNIVIEPTMETARGAKRPITPSASRSASRSRGNATFKSSNAHTLNGV